MSPPDYADSSVYAAWYSGPWLGLPNRDYYWDDDEGNEDDPQRLPGDERDAARPCRIRRGPRQRRPRRVYDLEKRLAEPILRPEDWNDPTTTTTRGRSPI